MKCRECGCGQGIACEVYPRLIIKNETDWSGLCRSATNKEINLYTNEIRIACPRAISFGNDFQVESSKPINRLPEEEAECYGQYYAGHA